MGAVGEGGEEVEQRERLADRALEAGRPRPCPRGPRCPSAGCRSRRPSRAAREARWSWLRRSCGGRGASGGGAAWRSGDGARGGRERDASTGRVASGRVRTPIPARRPTARWWPAWVAVASLLAAGAPSAPARSMAMVSRAASTAERAIRTRRESKAMPSHRRLPARFQRAGGLLDVCPGGLDRQRARFSRSAVCGPKAEGAEFVARVGRVLDPGGEGAGRCWSRSRSASPCRRRTCSNQSRPRIFG